MVKLIARDAVFVQQTYFRAFLHLTKEECDDMGMDQYINNFIMLKDVLHLLHAPFMSNDKVTTTNG